SRGDFTGVGPVVVLAHVLRTEADVGVENGPRNLAQRGVGRAYHDVQLLDVGQVALETGNQIEALGHGLVHLPVPGNDQSAVFFHENINSRNYFSESAATPGNSCPSRNSRLAP